MQHHYLVAYDIRDPGRLRRVHRICRDFGDPLQLSVFVCRLTDKDLVVFRERLRRQINHDEDQVLFVRLGRVGHEDAMEARLFSLGLQWVPPGMPELIF